MNTRYVLVSLVMISGLLLVAAYQFAGIRPASPGDDTLSFVDLPEGFDITVYADGFGNAQVSAPGPAPGPRFMAFRNGTLYVSIPSQDRVVALPDRDGDGSAEEPVTVLDGLNRPHGIAFHSDDIYVANTDGVVRARMDGMTAVPDTREVVVDGVPTGGHWTRTIRIHNGSLYISVGSSCNVCHESDEWRAAIHRCTLQGNCSVYARGLRNAVGFVFHDGNLIATENGRDNLGNDMPPDEINVVDEGENYGWPECYGDNVLDTRFHPDDGHRHIRPHCTAPFEQPAAVELQAHSAPLGLAFYTADAFPRDYRGDLYVAYHGSWNRQPPTGYKVVRIPYNGTFGAPEDFATGWLDGGTVHGRPVDIAVGPDGAMYVSDDNSGRIYRITYR